MHWRAGITRVSRALSSVTTCWQFGVDDQNSHETAANLHAVCRHARNTCQGATSNDSAICFSALLAVTPPVTEVDADLDVLLAQKHKLLYT